MPKNDPCYEEAKRLQYLLSLSAQHDADGPPPDVAVVAEHREKLRKALAARVTITDYVKRVTAWGAEKGWNDVLCVIPANEPAAGVMPDERQEPEKPDAVLVGMKIALMHSELSEALEEVREGEGHYGTRFELDAEGEPKPEGVVVEFADTIIRIFHVCGLLGLDLQAALEAKLDYNDGRAFRHGGKAC